MNNLSTWESSTPLVIAHRGASAYAPENTASAFLEAIKMKADAAELDAKLLRDGTIIVLHDITLNRTTDGQGSVYQYTYNEIHDYDAGSHFSPEFSSEIIPTLETIFNQFGENLLFNVELTNYTRPWDGLPKAVIKLIQKYRLEKRVLLSSFNPWVLFVSKRMDPTIPIALLFHHARGKLYRNLMLTLLDPMAIHPFYTDVSKELVTEAKNNKRKINVWTINEKQKMIELIRIGVNGLITDFPDVAREVVNEIQKNPNNN